MRALLVAEASGGHVIPALQVAGQLAGRRVETRLWHAERRPLAGLARALARAAAAASVDVRPVPMPASRAAWRRLADAARLWRLAHRELAAWPPDVVVGFGGWFSVPVICAAKRRGIRCVIHEQNVRLGRANRLLAHWADQIALSFQETDAGRFSPRAVLTGMPVRETIGRGSHAEAAARFGFDPRQPTLLVLGGSQGSRVLNRLVVGMLTEAPERDRRSWQVLHLAGPSDAAAIKLAYAAHPIRARVAPFVADMTFAYALADLVIARAGAATVAELARCGIPAILIPYPHAGAHQQANAEVAEETGGVLTLGEAAATPARLWEVARPLFDDPARRARMGRAIHGLDHPDAAERLCRMILGESASRELRSREPKGAPAGAAVSRRAPCGAPAGGGASAW